MAITTTDTILMRRDPLQRIRLINASRNTVNTIPNIQCDTNTINPVPISSIIPQIPRPPRSLLHRHLIHTRHNIHKRSLPPKKNTLRFPQSYCHRNPCMITLAQHTTHMKSSKHRRRPMHARSRNLNLPRIMLRKAAPGTAKYRNACHGGTTRLKRLSYSMVTSSSTPLYPRNCLMSVHCATSGSLRTCGTRRRHAIPTTFNKLGLR